MILELIDNRYAVYLTLLELPVALNRINISEQGIPPTFIYNTACITGYLTADWSNYRLTVDGEDTRLQLPTSILVPFFLTRKCSQILQRPTYLSRLLIGTAGVYIAVPKLVTVALPMPTYDHNPITENLDAAIPDTDNPPSSPGVSSASHQFILQSPLISSIQGNYPDHE